MTLFVVCVLGYVAYRVGKFAVKTFDPVTGITLGQRLSNWLFKK